MKLFLLMSKAFSILSMPQNKVYINHHEAVCCAGKSASELFDAICEHRSGISVVDNWVNDKCVAIGDIKESFRLEALLSDVCERVLFQSGLENFHNTLLVVGSSVGGMQLTENTFLKDYTYTNINPKLHPIDAIAYLLNERYRFADDISFSTACTSSANALGYAHEVISKGVYENILVIGCDTLSLTTVRGFDTLGVLSSSPCKPFDSERDGMNVAEGIGALLLSHQPAGKSVELKSVGYSSDAHHMAHPSPDGAGAEAAMKQALKRAGLSPDAIDYINAHGTGTGANDSAEAEAIYRLFGAHVPVSSTKSITGHTLGAAGAIEAIICAEALHRQIVPPNTHLNTPEKAELYLVKEPQSKKLVNVMSNSLAFGGNNTSLILGF